MSFKVGDKVRLTRPIGPFRHGEVGVVTHLQGDPAGPASYDFRVQFDDSDTKSLLVDADEVALVEEEYVKKSDLEAALCEWGYPPGSPFHHCLARHGITFEKPKRRIRIEFDVDAGEWDSLKVDADMGQTFLGLPVENLTVEEVTNDS